MDVLPNDLIEKDYGQDQFYDDLSSQKDLFYNGCEERKFTNKKGKKVAQYDFEVYKADCRFTRAVAGFATREFPPEGKSMLKQVFAGQYGLTFIATMYFAMVCGRPLDINMGWDATSRLGRKMLYMDLQNKDP